MRCCNRVPPEPYSQQCYSSYNRKILSSTGFSGGWFPAALHPSEEEEEEEEFPLREKDILCHGFMAHTHFAPPRVCAVIVLAPLDVDFASSGASSS
jgi:hypothetical protein